MRFLCTLLILTTATATLIGILPLAAGAALAEGPNLVYRVWANILVGNAEIVILLCLVTSALTWGETRATQWMMWICAMTTIPAAMLYVFLWANTNSAERLAAILFWAAAPVLSAILAALMWRRRESGKTPRAYLTTSL